jgi:hypothetical protein
MYEVCRRLEKGPQLEIGRVRSKRPHADVHHYNRIEGKKKTGLIGILLFQYIIIMI